MLTIIAGAIMGALVAGGVAVAQLDPVAMIQACQKPSGLVRVVDSPDDCRRRETPIAWNIEGPAGPIGPQGAAGPHGPQGEPGPPGAGDKCSAYLRPGIDLSGCNFAGAVLDAPNLQQANLSDADLSRTFSGSNGNSAPDFSGANMRRVDLSDATMRSPVLTDTNLTDADMHGANLSRASNTLLRTILRRTNFTAAVLGGTGVLSDPAEFVRVSAVGADFSSAELAGVTFQRSNLAGAHFAGALNLDTVTWLNTTCPDGTNSDNNGRTCENNLVP